eukprot:GHVP01027548.1.p1 GENE.GHVP01027548.1~~GHVP01027548.1.p1  ORF type:complete len:101 (-),score=14.14 GHVP01027548.1:1319-1621(-)
MFRNDDDDFEERAYLDLFTTTLFKSTILRAEAQNFTQVDLQNILLSKTTISLRSRRLSYVANRKKMFLLVIEMKQNDKKHQTPILQACTLCNSVSNKDAK